MKTILIAGGSGLVGTRITELLDSTEYRIIILTRFPKPPKGNITYLYWDIYKGVIDDRALYADYLINLTGDGIADSRWTTKRKKILIDSRVNGTLLIQSAMKKANRRFKAAVSASAIGYYGDQGDTILDERNNPGDEFLSTCCLLWENASEQLQEVTDYNRIVRVGLVLSTRGGALPKILMTKTVRLFNYFGNGKQYYSWIHIDDISRMFIHLLTERSDHSVYNGVAPRPLTNKKFTEEVRDAFGSGIVLPAPALGLKIALGEMSKVVLNSNRVLPKNFTEVGFRFEFPDLTNAIKDLLVREV
ncbi:TIGR01777 family oxidoreductase [Saprospiraceae bacterium]|uniref:NAD dependent epimerase/dehydratase family protein n=1 Tax=uncultured Flavobacteriia bacterium TaxID=212695 RepID=H6REL1_9BACT|nr:cell division inhibitor [uncultured bacterium]MDA9181626.1 TIGR01777 family oxidoreductase [Saprospiraceae bacterium]CCF99472.1 NAD dependent epimerase/dehydratase family protein [uncultured Flavobacteriia bacterium]HAV29148.1 TIGR01777 family protein [Saprospirales bacterium]